MPTTKIKSWKLTDVGLADCWHLIGDAIEYDVLQDDDVPRLLAFLRNGHDLILDDLAFEFLGDSLRVRFRDDECICEPAVLVAELEAAIREEAPL